MSIALLTQLHVLISLFAIVAGVVVVYGMLQADTMATWTHLFLATTIATSLTGFLFPITKFTPALAFGVLSILVLIPTVLAVYKFKLTGRWRTIYVVGAIFALYLNLFVLIVQSFLKIPSLHVLAPQGNEPPFAVAQAILLVSAILAGFFAVRRFRNAAV